MSVKFTHVGQTYISYTIRLISHSMNTSVILNQHILNNWHPCCNQTASLRTAHPCQLKTFPDWVLYFPWVTLFTDTTAQHLVRHLNPFWSVPRSNHWNNIAVNILGKEPSCSPWSPALHCAWAERQNMSKSSTKMRCTNISQVMLTCPWVKRSNVSMVIQNQKWKPSHAPGRKTQVYRLIN
jgi:hypothetical protein